MAINFRSIVTDPKIEIVGDEVPVAAFEKASNILNQRYAQSAEAATRAQEALQQQLQTANPLEREQLKAYYDNVYGQLTNIATTDDYLDQEWKTKSLGLRTAANLKAQEERAKLAQTHLDAIRLAKNISNPEIRKMYENEYNKQFAETKYDPNTGLINFGTLNPPRVVEDINAAERLNKGLTGWAANKLGRDYGDVEVISKGQIIPGTNVPAQRTIIYDKKTRKQVEEITEPEIRQGAIDYLNSDPEVASVLQRDAKYLMSKNPELDANQAIQIAKKQLIDPAVNFITGKLAYKYDIIQTDKDYNAGLTNEANVGSGQPNSFFNIPWQATLTDVNTEQLVQPDMEKKTEVSSVAFNKDGSFKQVPQSLLNKIENFAFSANKTGPNSNGIQSLNTLVPDWQVARIRANNPKLTDKQVYETFMDDVINSKKQLSATYVLADPGLRNAFNSNTKALIQTMPIYKLDGGELKEVTGEERDKALKEQVGFIPGTGQVKLGNSYVTGLGVLKPGEQAQDLNPTQTMMAMTSQMITAALDPTVSNATTANRTFNIPNANGQQTPVRLRILKSGVGKPIINSKTGERMLYPTTIQVVDQISGKAIGDFNVENNQGISEFTNFMLNNAAGSYMLQ